MGMVKAGDGVGGELGQIRDDFAKVVGKGGDFGWDGSQNGDEPFTQTICIEVGGLRFNRTEASGHCGGVVGLWDGGGFYWNGGNLGMGGCDDDDDDDDDEGSIVVVVVVVAKIWI